MTSTEEKTASLPPSRRWRVSPVFPPARDDSLGTELLFSVFVRPYYHPGMEIRPVGEKACKNRRFDPVSTPEMTRQAFAFR
jgi:hypothetical protein